MKDSRHNVLRFWFEETAPAQWFQVNPEFDAMILQRFHALHKFACEGYFADWSHDPDGSLALILLTDQFPRNMFRGMAQAYMSDHLALATAQNAIHNGFDLIHPILRRRFFYLPLMHAETREAQDACVTHFEKIKTDDPVGYESALKHRDEIIRFGRFPRRNAILGRDTTPDEHIFLQNSA